MGNPLHPFGQSDTGNQNLEPAPPEIEFYVLVCRVCGDGDDALELPFTSAEDRGRWAAEHKRGTGHDRWLVLDVPRG